MGEEVEGLEDHSDVGTKLGQAGAFGMPADELAAELERARAIHQRSDVIARLSTDTGEAE
jgi:hypothetical protein